MNQIKADLERAVKEAGEYANYIRVGIDRLARLTYPTQEYRETSTQIDNCLYLIKRKSEFSYGYFNHIINNIRQIKGDNEKR